jgi:hypothetical protein
VKRLAIRFVRKFAHKIEASFRTRERTMILIKISLFLISTGLRALQTRVQPYLRLRTVGPNSSCAPSSAPPLYKAWGVLE